MLYQLSYTPSSSTLESGDSTILLQSDVFVTSVDSLKISCNLLYNGVMSSKLRLTRPTLFMVYGYPGAGKTFFARQFCEDITAAHLQGERIRSELFEDPRYDSEENGIVTHLLDYMTGEFLTAEVSVVYDVNALRMSQRRELREMARKHKAEVVMLWFQIDAESAFARAHKRDRRRVDDKYSESIDRTTFQSIAGGMQNPGLKEEYVVISGKHTYQTQRASVLKKLYDTGLLDTSAAKGNVVKPGLVNLIPNPLGGRVDDTRRNIFIR